jgi:hypothetical protein
MKMKTYRKLFYSFLCLCLVASCEYDDSPLDEDTVASNTGAVLTTVSTVGGTINKLNPSESSLVNTVLFNDFNNNDTMESVDIFLLFADTTPNDDGQLLPSQEILVETIPASSFQIGDSGYPENTYSINAETMLSTLNLDASLIDGGDLFIVRYKLNLTDGRSFSAADTGTNVRTTSHGAPFRYSSVVVCFKVPEPGDWSLEMIDVYGDSWNGGNIVISIDGEETTYACAGSSTTETITVPQGTSRFLFTYNAGEWEGENLYTLTDPNGEVVLQDGVGDGSQTNGPATGEQFNTCD